VRINDIQKIVELDSGMKETDPRPEIVSVQKIENEDHMRVERDMAIAIPIKNEKVKIFEGVLSGIPHECLIIVVSNSERERVDRFRIERDTLEQFCKFTRHPAIIVHQKNEGIASAFKRAGYSEILDKSGLVRDGKAEGMLIGIMLAKLFNKNYIGFIDADNFVPGAVNEYVKCFGAGFIMANSPFSMVRISWRYKPKIREKIYFRKWGRISEVTNKYINSIISSNTGFDTEIIKTGNAGEHGMSLRLAEMIPYSSGFAIEPYELITIFEEFGGVGPTEHKEVIEKGVDIFQIETRNPHFHAEKGEEHLKELLLKSLSTIYHSDLCDKNIKEQIRQVLVNQSVLTKRQRPPKPIIMPPLHRCNFKKFRKVIEEQPMSYQRICD
jgi:mannosyl-3-phosphoglycerate synthase